ncbi:MAG TPA: HEAT repeat domain-containing protein [Kofleriaceae bacterium]|nr:HEAT repeat domain-containing protein [Kofleriaceae bacterium]
MRLLRAVLGVALLGVVARPALAGFNWVGQVEADAEGLTSDDAKKRLEAVALLGMDDIHLAQPYLMKSLLDADESVRHQAAKALGAGGAMAAVAPMVEWLSDPDAKTRAVAAEVLGDLGGPEATSALTRSLGDSDPVVRQHAVKSLGRIGARGNPSVVIALIPRLDDEKSDVRRETVEQLEELGDRRAVIPLVAKFGDTSLEVKKAAVRAIGKLGDRAAVPALIRLMNDPQDETVRMAAVGALGQLGAVDALDALTEQLSTGSDTYREKVAYALGQIAASPNAGKAGEDAMRVLVENLAQQSTRHAANEALRVAGRAAVPALVEHLAGRLKGDPTSAVKLLGEGADPRATATLAAELERGRVAIPLVLKALGATGDPAALVPVLGVLGNKDPAIRLAAMEALRPLLGRDARAGDVLVEHLADDDLEVRVLAAEYLGTLGIATATPRLVALAGPGNPTRLRLAAIDALGEIGKPEAARALVDVLREGPTELHRAAATALSYIADPATIPALIAQAQSDRGPTRDEIVRALGATLRGHPDPAARRLLRALTDDANLKVGVAAICGLAAAGDVADDAPLLRTLVDQAATDRRRAAAWALGELHDPGGWDPLARAMSAKDDRVVGDAAWALGELAAAAPRDPHLATTIDRWLYVAHHGTWAGPIDSAAALARTLWATPAAGRAALVAGTRRTALYGLAFHKSRLVRIDAALALAALAAAGDDDAAKALGQLVHDDPSPHVRIAAAQGLARAAAASGSKELATKLSAALAAADADSDQAVRQAARAVAGAPPAQLAALPARGEWRTFYVVDPSADDAPVRQEPYFVHTGDGVVWASFTDARGELTSEHVPPGDATVWPASREGEY